MGRVLKKHKYLFIYKTTNLVNGKIYVGYHRANKLNDRYIGNGICYQWEAIYDLPFHNAVKKYKYENFKREIIEFVETEDQLSPREIFWIAKLDARNSEIGYNIDPGGRGGDTFTNNPRKEEIRENASKRMKGRPALNKGKPGKKRKLSSIKNARKTFFKRPIEVCTYCGHQSRSPAYMMKFHFENCRQSSSNIIIEEIRRIKKKEERRCERKIQSLQTCTHCGYESRNAGKMKLCHGDNCKQNPDYVDKRPIYTCEFCGYQTRNKGDMIQYHGDNCKKNPNYIIKEKKPDTRELQTCPHCGFQSKSLSNMKRYHFDNCKYKI